MDEADQWLDGKQRHRELSAKAAPTYDAEYGEGNFATQSYMQYELDVISRAIDLIDKDRRQLAVDLGCGTGRDAFHFYRRFSQVSAFDFSPEMIAEAERTKLAKHVGNVGFEIRDVDEDFLTEIPDGSVAFVNSGFGMGSFIRDPGPFFREIKRVLEPGGVFVVSFYNRQSLVVRLTDLRWDPALAARFDPDSGFLSVRLTDGTDFPVAAKPYEYKAVRGLLAHYFELVELTTYPTLSALFPQEMFESEPARALCTVVDKQLAGNEEIAGGPYIVAICRRRGKAAADRVPFGYENILHVLANHRVPLNIKYHEPVSSPREVARLLQVDESALIKTILLRIEPDPAPDGRMTPPATYWAAALQATRKVDIAKVSELLNVKRGRVLIADTHELEEVTGFSVGGVPPFGYPRTIGVLLDRRVHDLERVYTGTGKPTESLRIAVTDLRRLASYTWADISK